MRNASFAFAVIFAAGLAAATAAPSSTVTYEQLYAAIKRATVDRALAGGR